jgi:hypothetical protein
MKLPWLALTLALSLAAPGVARSDEIARADLPVEPRVGRHQVALELVPLAAALSYAFRPWPNTSFGIKAGFGLHLISVVAVGGRHFASEGGLAYTERDEYTDKRYAEIAQAALFVRHFFPHGIELETGLRRAGGLHMDSSDDDAGAAEFFGAYSQLFWRAGRNVSFGTGFSAGRIWEAGGSAAPDEFAVILNPIILKLNTR